LLSDQREHDMAQVALRQHAPGAQDVVAAVAARAEAAPPEPAAPVPAGRPVTFVV
jgi:hypothetical protein